MRSIWGKRKPEEREIAPQVLILPASSNLSSVYEPDIVNTLSLSPEKYLEEAVDPEYVSETAKKMFKGEEPYSKTIETKEGPMEIYIVAAEDSPEILIKDGEKEGYSDRLIVSGWDFLLAYLYRNGKYYFQKADGRIIPFVEYIGDEPKFTNPREFSINGAKEGDEFRFIREFSSAEGEKYYGVVDAMILHTYGDVVPKLILMAPKGQRPENVVIQKYSEGKNPVIACEKRFEPIIEAYLQYRNIKYDAMPVTRKAETMIGKWADLVVDLVFSGDSARKNGLDPERGEIVLDGSYPVKIIYRKVKDITAPTPLVQA